MSAERLHRPELGVVVPQEAFEVNPGLAQEIKETLARIGREVQGAINTPQ